MHGYSELKTGFEFQHHNSHIFLPSKRIQNGMPKARMPEKDHTVRHHKLGYNPKNNGKLWLFASTEFI